MHIDLDIAAIQPAKLCESLLKSCNPRLPLRVITGPHQHSDVSHSLGLLRAHRERPRCRAAEQRNERAALHSITSSASASSLSGTSCLSAFAVLRLITSSNFCRLQGPAGQKVCHP
jgi:hypothetical protein